ncbi:hypothetical protein G9A89_020857 [Geosiphon pyriformis]|nr:hypothetical protein G9A89_020857 [Geosiphon pyriformis]
MSKCMKKIAIDYVVQSWFQVTSVTIQNCWQKTDILFYNQELEIQESETSITMDIFNNLPSNAQKLVKNLEDFTVAVDKLLATENILDDNDIVDMVLADAQIETNTINDSEEELEESPPAIITITEAYEALKKDGYLTFPIVVDGKNQIKVPFQFNRITKRSQSIPKILMDPENGILPLYEGVALLASDAYCNATSGIIDVKFGFLPNKDEMALVVYFAGQKIEKKKWPNVIQRQLLFQVKGFPTFDDDARVSKPFLEIIESLFPRILENIRECLKKSPKATQIFFVGHAIGGAYASIAGIRWAMQRYLITESNLWPEIDMKDMGQQVITFGAPRIGNSRFSRFANDVIAHHRITHGNDHAPQFPLDRLKWNHFGFEIWIEPLENCNCPDDVNFHPYSYWDCNNKFLQETQRRIWLEKWSSENMECNGGQSIINVPDDLFHNGPYFGIRMGDCIKTASPKSASVRGFRFW